MMNKIEELKNGEEAEVKMREKDIKRLQIEEEDKITLKEEREKREKEFADEEIKLLEQLDFTPMIIEKVKHFPRAYMEEDLTETIGKMIHITDKLYENTKKDLAGKFSVNEALLICDVIGWHVDICSISNFKSFIFMEIEDSIICNYADIIFEVGKEILLNKIQELTNAESMALIMMSVEACNYDTSECFDFTDVLNDVFAVNE